MSINDIKTGERARVKGLLAHGTMRRRMLDIGLVNGAEVECVGQSPMGDPRAYLICGAVIAIRRSDGDNVIIEDI
ncbi:MAG: ferrous iron transport protein A [Oscillospiraceae bacterium]|nr:ferrous iron transport protein A [Oscillospiraceae bacterium]